MLSSALFLLPALYAFSLGEIVFGTLAVITAGISTWYHLVKPEGPHWWSDKKATSYQNLMLSLDTLVAIIFVLYSVYIFYIKDFPNTFFIAVIFFIPLFIQFLIPTKKYYELQHTLWHVGAACLAFLPLL